jgi:hypothetical protein
MLLQRKAVLALRATHVTADCSATTAPRATLPDLAAKLLAAAWQCHGHV